MSALRRAADLLRAFWRISLVEDLQYRANFFASFAGSMFWLLMALLTLAVFFRQTDDLGGWTFWEVVALLGVFNTLAGVIDTFLRPGIGRLVQDVRKGTLDLILVRPVETQLYVSIRRVNVWSLGEMLLGLGLIAVAAVKLGRAPSPGDMGAFIVAMASATAIVYSIWLALMSLAFWVVAVENLSVLFDAVYQAARYPASAYPGALRFLFVYLLPVAWTTTVPASALTGRLGWSVVGLAAGVGVAALVGTRVLWRIALRRYTSTG